MESEGSLAAVANVDGGTRGNPGPAAYGALITKADGTTVELEGFRG